jgi:UDP-GlcNAc:undecaprenyl-phosphate GlcNAc-1-phosphate transferase
VIWTVLISLLVAAIAAWVLTLLSERLGLGLGLVDSPGGPLKIHTQPTPRFGGLAIFGALVTAQSCASLFDLPAFTRPELILAAALFLLGTWDDFKPRSPLLRLLLQLLIFALSWALGVRAHMTRWEGFDACFGAVLFVVVINAVNFFDGMDGLLALTAACALGVWAAVSADTGGVWLPFALGSVVLLGFLPRNWHPARTFLGDGGSFVVGFLFYLVFVRSAAAGYERLAGFWVAAVPVCDAVAATLDRAFRHGKVFAGDRDHVYDMLGRLGLPPPSVALVLGLLAAVIARAAAVLSKLPMVAAVLITTVLYAFLILVVMAMRWRFRLGDGPAREHLGS